MLQNFLENLMLSSGDNYMSPRKDNFLSGEEN